MNIIRCDKKSSNICKCAGIATRMVLLKSKALKDNPTSTLQLRYRCEEHAISSTAKKVVVESTPFDQSNKLVQINAYLHSLIGKNIRSNAHTAKELRVKYVKPNTGGVMCFQEHSNKWKFVYSEQITAVLD